MRTATTGQLAWPASGSFSSRAGPVGEDQQRALELPLADFQAVLQVAMIVLIRLRMHDDGVIDARPLHALEQVLRRRGFSGSYGARS